MKTSEILFGVAYYDEYMPYDRIETDMQMMQKANMNVIRIAESTWSTMEPIEGTFDFTHLDRMLNASEKYGIKVIIGTPTYAIPSWLCKKYPDILAITNNGPEIYGHRQNMDITHPGYLKHCEIIIRHLLEHIKNRTNIIGFQLDNETKSYGTAGPRPQKLFVEYLKKLYPDINQFNQDFGLNYWSNRIQNWEDFPDIRGTINNSLSAEYKKFQRSLVSDFLSWQAGIVKEYSSGNQFITQNFDYGWTHDHSFGMQPEVNQYEAAKDLTVAGFDIYHPSQDSLTGTEISFGGDIARSIKKSNYLVMETQSQGNLSWLPYDNQLLLQAFSHLASGSNSVMYWNWHSIHNAIESYWKGVLSHDLKENRTYLETVKIGHELQKYSNRIKNLKKKNQIAILLDNHSLTGLQEFPIASEFTYNHIFRWLYDVLYRLNIECDIIQSSDLSALASLSEYKCLVVPALYSASDKMISIIDSYVAEGGHLLATFKTAFSDEHLKIRHDRQPYGLTECLGIRYSQFTVPKDVSLSFKDEYAETFNVADSSQKPAYVSLWMELLEPTTAKALALYHHPNWSEYAAITSNTYKKGTGTYLGCYFDDNSLLKFMKKYLQEIGFPLTNLEFPIISKNGLNDYNNKIHYYFNYSNKSIDFQYEYPDATNLRTDEKITSGTKYTLPPWDFIVLEEI